MVLVFEKMFEIFTHAMCKLWGCQGGSMLAMDEGALFELVLQEIKQKELPFQVVAGSR